MEYQEAWWKSLFPCVPPASLDDPKSPPDPLSPLLQMAFCQGFRCVHVCLFVFVIFQGTVLGLCPSKQIDLINMRHLPDGAIKWILHGVDH